MNSSVISSIFFLFLGSQSTPSFLIYNVKSISLVHLNNGPGFYILHYREVHFKYFLLGGAQIRVLFTIYFCPNKYFLVISLVSYMLLHLFLLFIVLDPVFRFSIKLYCLTLGWLI